MATPWHYAQIQDQRDETFERVRRVFRWTVAGAIAGVAVIIGVVAHEIPGRSTVGHHLEQWGRDAATTRPATPGAATPGGTPGGTPGQVLSLRR